MPYPPVPPSEPLHGNLAAYWSLRAGELVDWISPWTEVVRGGFRDEKIEWFVNGKLNVSVNCVDRHAARHPEKIAIHHEGNTAGDTAQLTYAELLDQVERAAAMLRAIGVQRGDRVAIYLPMIPEAAVVMLACARIGAVHTVVFAGFSPEALRDRLNDCGVSVVVTSDEAVRGEKRIPLKQMTDEALLSAPAVRNVIVVKRTGADVPFDPLRDRWWNDLMAQADRSMGTPEAMDAEDPLFILYTSGSTGRPKGVLHTQGGYLVYAAHSQRIAFGLQDDDVFFCTADVGWITGHTYVVYASLCNGVTTVMFEPTPVYPDAARYWQAVERTRATIFYTAPTAIRTLAKESIDFVKKCDLSSLRVLGTVGEPINPDAWRWYQQVVGAGCRPVIDTWWQTETGGVLISPLPNGMPLKPGSAALPLPGIVPVVLNDAGEECGETEAAGQLVIAEPWPGMMRTVFGDHQRFVDTYLKPAPGYYFTGDGCRRDSDGYYWITGRIDDVLNVAGHRLGTAELEAAVVRSAKVAEAAVVGFPHEMKGTATVAFCVLLPGVTGNADTERIIRETVRRVISPIASLDRIVFVSALPKTRSGKIMRRILKRVVAGEESDFGDTSTLSEPSSVEDAVRAFREFGAYD
jgi:acetyl-CoA synthetase